MERLVTELAVSGLQAQVDFADFRFPWGRRHALLVVVGYSRLEDLEYPGAPEVVLPDGPGQGPGRSGSPPPASAADTARRAPRPARRS
jgi:hypothetical protein